MLVFKAVFFLPYLCVLGVNGESLQASVAAAFVLFFGFGSDPILAVLIRFFLRSARFSSRSDPGSRNERSPHVAVLRLRVLHLFQGVLLRLVDRHGSPCRWKTGKH